ncbi:sugar ABC transporter substrate-binding protein [Capillimicrobium parvum]|uniref:sugar ABC transporter substrate-binding protein n=1 Tax=Capillimicrobium parvum TaxID=2884022 RepID=UPI00216AF49D|nr:sugar ABC transporter substrate-binding protein [Capillimicrobium parvum]
MISKYSTPGTEIAPKVAGLKPFKAKEGASIYNIACALSIEACQATANGMKEASQALGYKYEQCDSGSSPEAPGQCFTNAINAKPDVIIAQAVGLNQAADGYAAARKAGIPIVAFGTGDKADGTVANIQIADQLCHDQGKILADAIAEDSDGKANVLFLGDTAIACDVSRTKGFEDQLKQACPDCDYNKLIFDLNTMQQSLPPQLQAELNKNPNINWIVGANDAPAAVAVTQVMQAGKQDQISVAGMDGQPSNVTFMLKKQVQKFDLTNPFADAPWSAVDAAARIYSGEEVPKSLQSPNYLLTWDNVKSLGPSKTYNGPDDYQEQYKAMWGKS